MGDKQYCLALGGWASGSSKVILCVIPPEGRNTSCSNISENSSNKAEINGSLAPGAKGVRGPSYSPSSMSLAPIARRLLDGYNNVNHAALCDLQTVSSRTSKSTSEYSQYKTWVQFLTRYRNRNHTHYV